MLYCALTGQLIAKSLDAVKLHMKGKKFQRAKGELVFRAGCSPRESSL
jgi:hypothetical protein